MAEIILSDVDRRLEGAGFEFLRFIDDYTCFAETREKASAFIRNLEIALSTYSLFLNFGKTQIGPLTGSELPEWIPALQVDALPASPNFFALKLYFSRVIALAEKHPEGSVLRYAIHALKDRDFDSISGGYVLRTLLALSLHHTHLASAIPDYLKFGYDNGQFLHAEELFAVLSAAVDARRSDAMCWALYMIKNAGIIVPAKLAGRALKTYDPCTLILLYESGDAQTRRSITNFAKKAILPRDHTVHERNWLLLHYLLNTKRLKPAEVTDRTLRLLQKEKIDFFRF